MRKSKLILLSLTLCCLSAHAQTDSLAIVNLQEQVSALTQSVNNIKTANITLTNRVISLENANTRLNDGLKQQQSGIVSLTNGMNDGFNRVKTETDTLSARLSAANDSIEKQSVANNKKSIWLAAAILLVLLLSALFYALTRKKMGGDAHAIKQLDEAQKSIHTMQEKLQAENVKLNNTLMDLLSKQVETVNPEPSKSDEAELDHSLVLSIINEVNRIEQNLNFMDASVKGISQLKNRAAAIISTLKSKGYEVPKLLGEKYCESDNMTATMELDENLDEGNQIIRRVIKPQVNYKGKMIQAAEVIVAYNE